MPTLDYDLNKRLLTLLRVDTQKERLSLLYQWVKTDLITKRQFLYLIEEVY